MQLARRRAQRGVWLLVGIVRQRGYDEHAVVMKVDRLQVDRSGAAVKSSVDAVAELLLQRGDDAVAPRGVDADRAVHKRFLRLRSLAECAEGENGRQEGGRELLQHVCGG